MHNLHGQRIRPADRAQLKQVAHLRPKPSFAGASPMNQYRIGKSQVRGVIFADVCRVAVRKWHHHFETSIKQMLSDGLDLGAILVVADKVNLEWCIRLEVGVLGWLSPELLEQICLQIFEGSLNQFCILQETGIGSQISQEARLFFFLRREIFGYPKQSEQGASVILRRKVLLKVDERTALSFGNNAVSCSDAMH